MIILHKNSTFIVLETLVSLLCNSNVVVGSSKLPTLSIWLFVCFSFYFDPPSGYSTVYLSFSSRYEEQNGKVKNKNKFLLFSQVLEFSSLLLISLPESSL